MILFLQISGWVMFGMIAVATIPTVVASLFHYLKPLSRADGGEYRGNEQIATPLVSVIMPARNEGAQIEQAMQSILASSGITLELIVVNDRSTDQTGAIINRLASADQRVHPIHITELPPGWLGKNHAMHVASEQARGTLLLFTDGDILFHPDAIQTAIQDLRSSEIQHLTILPQMLPGSIGERASIAFFGLAFLIGVQLPLLRTRFPMAYAGVGAFNLIDADFYRRMGGHKALRLNVLDDMYLGKHVKQAGGIHNLKFGPDLLAVRWQPSWWGIITGLEKNGFAALGYSIPRVLMATV
ncbi:MAG: glycosyltransferase, partial [Planctomycetaceae bacterium]|nr:glycosyltransferase [Planctomycetaceae bacterium]